MPLVGGNELSLFSISFTICFYLVINESSVWYSSRPQAVYLLQRSAAKQPVKPHFCFLYTHADATSHATHTHTHMYMTHKNIFIPTVASLPF